MAQPLSLSELAAELHVSPFHLTRVFRERTGRTLTAYLHDLRLRTAVERLDADPGAPLSRVAADLGYCTPSHFTDRFRAAFGVPPSQLRNLMEAPARANS
jgi:AraC-like DNA-binding protein